MVVVTPYYWKQKSHILFVVVVPLHFNGVLREVCVVRAKRGQDSFPSFKTQWLPLSIVTMKNSKNGFSAAT